MEINIREFGSSINKKSQRIIVKEKDVKKEYPFFEINRINIYTAAVSISGSVIEACMKNGIRINFFRYNGMPIGNFSPNCLNGTVITKRKQILSFENGKGSVLAAKMVEGKLKNQYSTLKYFLKNRKNYKEENIDEIYKLGENIGTIIESDKKEEDKRKFIMGIEGRGAVIYWENIKRVLENKVKFEGRVHQRTNCPVNAMLNYGYAILYTRVWEAIELAGLDAFAGILHSDRAGKKSFIYDLCEEFRSIVVDRAVISLVNLGQTSKIVNGILKEEDKKNIVERINKILESRCEYNEKRYTMAYIIQAQARKAASYFREESEYTPFIWRW